MPLQDGDSINFPSHKFAFGERLDLRSCKKKTPKIIYDGEISNASLATLLGSSDEYYRIDSDILRSIREETLISFNVDINKTVW